MAGVEKADSSTAILHVKAAIEQDSLTHGPEVLVHAIYRLLTLRRQKARRPISTGKIWFERIGYLEVATKFHKQMLQASRSY